MTFVKKYFRLCFSCFFCFLSIKTSASEIDSIHTLLQLNSFLLSRVDAGLVPLLPRNGFTVDAHYYAANSFYKADLNGDNRTDLVVIPPDGAMFYAVLDKGDSKFELVTSSYSLPYAAQYTRVYNHLLSMHNAGSEILLVKNEQVFINDSETFYTSPDTLVCRYGTFINYNSKPDTFSIEHVKIYVDELLINSVDIDLDASLRFRYNYPYPEDFSDTIISVNEFGYVCSIINYLGFSQYKDEFRRDCDDCGELYLTVTYRNGTVKRIKDHGMAGTAGLKMLYHQLFNLCIKYKR